VIRFAVAALHRRPGRHAAVLVVVAGAAAVSSGILSVLLAADGAGLAHLTEPDRSRAVALSTETTLPLLALSLGLAAFTSVFLVASTVGFALDARHRELGLLRLLGAAPRQVAALAVGEATVLGALGGAAGAALGVPLAGVVRTLLVGAGLADPGLRVPASWQAVAVTVAVGCVTAALGACGPARRAGRTAPAEALALPGGARRAMTAGRWVLGAGAVLAGAWTVLAAPPEDDDAVLGLALLASVLLVVALAAFAPLVVPAVARVIAAAVRPIAPAAALLARSDTRLHARRTAALAAPLLLVAGLYTGLGTLSATARTMPDAAPDDPVPAALVVEEATGPATGSLAERRRACGGVPGVAVCAPVAPLPGSWAVGGAPGTGGLVVDPATAAAVGVRTSEGDLDGLSGDVVGVGVHVEHDGAIRYTDATGARHDLRAGPVVTDDGPFHPGWAPVLTFDQLASWGAPEPAGTELWVVLAPGADAEAVTTGLRSVLDGQVGTVAAWRAARADDEVAENSAALLTLFGAAECLALTAVAVTCASSGRDRRGQTVLLRRTGATNRQVVGAALLEVTLVAVVACVLVAVVQAGLLSRIGLLLPGTTVVAPWRELAVLLGLGTGVAAVATLATTLHEVRRAGRGAG
jgi:putative ABC transport system permease protein